MPLKHVEHCKSAIASGSPEGTIVHLPWSLKSPLQETVRDRSPDDELQKVKGPSCDAWYPGPPSGTSCFGSS